MQPTSNPLLGQRFDCIIKCPFPEQSKPLGRVKRERPVNNTLGADGILGAC
jgi:hypothetical protein